MKSRKRKSVIILFSFLGLFVCSACILLSMFLQESPLPRASKASPENRTGNRKILEVDRRTRNKKRIKELVYGLSKSSVDTDTGMNPKDTAQQKEKNSEEKYGDLLKNEELRDKIISYSWEYTPIFLEEILVGEEDDPVWEENIKDEAEELFLRENVTGTKIIDIQCGRTLCKTVQSHDSQEAFEFFRDEIKGPWKRGEAHGTSNPLDNGTIESTVYFSKNSDRSAFAEAVARISEL